MARSALLRLAACTLCLSASPIALHGQQQNARFDLAGPKIDIRVTRGGEALPIAQVPNLLAGDHLWLHADLPESQSVRYLLVAIFLRGTTNPPPENWIVKIETWNRHIRAEGEEIVVPDGAQQALLLLAPETGGDLSTLRSAVRGHPGVFVRASQDLAEAGFEQARIEKYLAEMQNVPPDDAKALAQHSDLLARTLNLKPNPECFKRAVDQQYNCLTQSGTQSLLDDGHGQSVVNSLTSGASSDLISAASTTSLAGGGVYSAYVGAIVDVVRIMSNLHTAHYQYIPAIAFPKDEALNLRLNVPPSFQNPKSVIVIGLPAVQAATPPPLRASDPKHVTCLLKPQVALPVEGAPLVFSTALAHALSLHRDLPLGGLDLPLSPDAFQGGLVIGAPEQRHVLATEDDASASPAATPSPAKAALKPASVAMKGEPVQQPATVNGMWGFDVFHGPTLPVQELPGEDWKLAHVGDSHLIVGEANQLRVTSTGTACIASVQLEQDGQAPQKLEWKQAETANTVDLSFKLASVTPGAVRLRVQQYGKLTPELLAVQAFSKPAHVSSIEFHVGDNFLILSGQGLLQIRQLELAGETFAPGANAAANARTAGGNAHGDTEEARSDSELRLDLASGQSGKLKAGDPLKADVTLADGRALEAPLTVQGARPALTILSRRIVQPAGPQPVQLLNPNDIPLDSTLLLSLRSAERFPRDAQVEISSDDNSLHVNLTLAEGSLVLQDRNTALAHVDLKQTFGASAFGELRLRLVLKDGTAGNWMPLGTLVRLPTLSGLVCTSTGEAACTLSGSDLYLISAVATDRVFSNPVAVPDGFVGASLTVPRPVNGTLFLKMRDDPDAIATATMAPQP